MGALVRPAFGLTVIGVNLTAPTWRVPQLAGFLKRRNRHSSPACRKTLIISALMRSGVAFKPLQYATYWKYGHFNQICNGLNLAQALLVLKMDILITIRCFLSERRVMYERSFRGNLRGAARYRGSRKGGDRKNESRASFVRWAMPGRVAVRVTKTRNCIGTGPMVQANPTDGLVGLTSESVGCVLVA